MAFTPIALFIHAASLAILAVLIATKQANAKTSIGIIAINVVGILMQAFVTFAAGLPK